MKIVVGLGNPEKKYENTLHNLGFMAVDKVAEEFDLKFSFKPALQCTLAQFNLNGEKIILVKPTTYMNLSGQAVKAVKDYFKAENKDILVIYDDLDIDVGRIRVKAEGSSGTHNGMRSIVSSIGATDFPRVRIGTKRDNENIDLIEYVLSNIPSDKKEAYSLAISDAASCAVDFIKGVSFDRIMNVYNTKRD